MQAVINYVLQFFTYSVFAVGAQNVIFTRALGLSNGLRMIDDSRKDIFYFCISLTVFQLLNSFIAYFTLPFLYSSSISQYARFIAPVVIVIGCAISYITVVFVLSLAADTKVFRSVIFSLTGSAINSAIVGTIIYSLYRGFNLAQTMGFAFGSSVGYLFAILLINEGQRKIHDELVPEHFRGLPVTLVYISILALAVYALTGHTMAL